MSSVQPSIYQTPYGPGAEFVRPTLNVSPYQGGFSMPAIVIPALIGAGASLGGAAISAHAAGKATDAQAAANAQALQFQRQQAQYQAATDETNRRANYDIYAAGQRRLGTVGQMLGFGDREIPGYVPTPPANYLAPQPTPQIPGILQAVFNKNRAARGQAPIGSVGSYL